MIDFDKPRSDASRAVADKAGITSAEVAFEFSEIALESTSGEARANTLAGRKINDVTAAVITLIVALSVIPAASVSPIFQMIWALAFGLIFAGHSIAMQIADPARRVMLPDLRLILMIGLAFPLAGVVQVGLASAGFETSFAGHTVPLGSIAPSASLLGVIRLLGYAALFMIAFEVSTRSGRINAMAWGLFAAIVLQAIWALIALNFLGDIVFWGEKSAYTGAATGTFVNRNSLATYLGMGLNLGIALTLAHKHRPHQRHPSGKHLFSERNLEVLALSFLLLLIAAALAATQSRMGTLAGFLSGLLTYVLMEVKYRKNLLGPLTRGAVILLIAIIIVSGVFGQALLERGLFMVGDSGSRTDLYREIFDLMIGVRPLTGTGLDTFSPAFELVHVPPVSSDVVWHLSHSSYLMLWSEMGLILGSLPMIAILLAAIRLIRTIRRRRTSYALPIVALSVIVQVALHSTIDFSLEIPANTILFLALVAIGIGPLKRKEKPE
jgi:O-antigen ligase